MLAALLYATFLQVPVAELGRSMRAGRFLTAALVVNFLVVPLVVAAMFAFLPAGQAVRMGVLLVLLTPCVDYVIVFSSLAGGSSQRLLALTPLLLLAQMALLPGYLYLFMGSELATIVEPGPFIEAFLVLIVIPLTLAWLTQALASRRRAGQKATGAINMAMVPLMAATLLTVVGSQVPKLRGNLGDVARVIPFYVLFLLIMAFAGLAVAKLFGLNRPDSRGHRVHRRNPLALALPDRLSIAAVTVVTQTLIEVIGMVLYIRAVPRLLPSR